MKMTAFLLTLALGTFAFAKTEPTKKTERFPANDAIETVKASSMKQAWARLLKKNASIRNAIKKVRTDYKDCGGSLGNLNIDGKMVTYSGKGSATSHYNEYLIPMVGGCSGTGMIEEAALVARLGVNTTVGEDDDETQDTYHFFGFVKVTSHPVNEPDQSSGLAR